MAELVLDSVARAAAALDHAEAQIRAGEVAQCLSIAALCDLHQVDETVLVDGAERWVRGGADGTPLVGEFVTAEIAGLLGVSVGAAFTRIARVLNLRHRHPTLWRLVIEGQVRAFEAFLVADAAATAHLDAAACERFDRMCAHALALQPWSRVRGQVERWLLLADPAQAAHNQEAAAARRHVTLGQIEHGHVGLWGQLDAADGLALDDALAQVAAGLDGETVDHRRATALGVLARSALGQEPLPTSHETGSDPAELGQPTDGPHTRHDMTISKGGVWRARRAAEVVVRLDAHDLATDGVATIDRWGHVLLPKLRDLLAGCRVLVRPVVAGGSLPAVDTHDPTAAMRLALVARTPVDVFPWGTRPAATCQIDHTLPYQAGVPGQTHVGNLGPLSSFTHRVKTHGGWRLEQPLPGTYRWRSPLGYEYEVTTTGTIRISRPPPPRHLWWQVEPPDDGDPPHHLIPPDGATLAGAPPDPGPRQRPLPYIA